MLSSITINDLIFDAKSGDQLDNVSLELKSPQVVGICSNDTGAATALEDLLAVRGKILNGDVTINGVPFKKYKRQSKNEIGRIDDVVLKGKTIEKAVKHALHHKENALTPEQTFEMIKALNLKPDQVVGELSESQQLELRVIILLAWQRPIVILSNAFDDIEEDRRQLLGSLVKDYTQKVNALVLFTSKNVSTLMRFADTLYYFSGSHLTSARDLSMNDGVDCTVTVMGTGFPIDNAVKLGAHMLEEASDETRFLFTGNIQALLPLLEQSTITDVRIEDATIEDELMAY
ncbi:multidrug ABC transporter ATPase [Limosilactobacillus albertensis]|nr:multidrug ABC transporter ATPase [Limosilactobacillus albertensis]MCD7118080.1 multidrug ABC transporter ATPase [Limosilactobacillus albertensis]MCD7127666.1 multidrug ABC transporter ATPase [Limosilactobacillus albertensis]